MDFLADIDACLATLQNGGTILYPTDTVWGLGCDATNEAAVKKIYALKQRQEANKMIVLVATERDVLKYTAQPDLAVFDYLNTLAKPTTVIYQGAIGLAENIVSPDGSIAIRICKDEFCSHLLKRFKKPIVSTSANTSGMPSPLSFTAIQPPIYNGVDYVVKHRQQDNSPHTPSAIIKWEKDGTISILRP